MKTKTLALLSALILVAASLPAQNAANAQHPTDRRDGLSLRAGFGMAGLGGNRLLDELTCAWNVGLHYEWRFAGRWGVDAGLELSHKGGAMSNSEHWDDDSRTVLRLNYLQLPVTLAHHFRVGKVDLAPYAGLYYAWCAGGRLDTWDLDGGEYSNAARGANQLVRRSDFGVRFGGGMSLRCGLYLGINADMGVVDFHHEHVDGIGFGCRNYTVSLQVGYNF